MIVRVYSKPACVQCTMTLRLFDDLGVDVVVDDATDQANVEAMKYLGFLAAPVVVVGESGDDMWAGFQPERIKEIAGRINDSGD